jgi:hypothetical protein
MNSLIHTFEAETCPRVWLAAAQFLSGQPARSAYNLVLAARTPAVLTPADFAIHDCVDDFLRTHGRPSVASVASTIFPANFYLQRGATGIYEDYVKVHPQLPRHWGMYAGRMLRKFAASEGKKRGSEINPLRILVEKMKKQVTGGRMRAVYEMNFLEDRELLELPIYDAVADARCTRGQPCLSHLSFKLVSAEQKLMLTVMYRNHFYVEKAIGNLIGLAQLLSFVAAEAGVRVGPLICHSTLAELDTGSWGVGGIAELMKECRAAESQARRPAGFLFVNNQSRG